MDYSMNITRYLGITAAILTLASVATGCGKNQSVDLRFGSYTVAKALPGARTETVYAQINRQPQIQEPILYFYRIAQWLDGFVPNANAAISQIKMCFKRLRFKQASESTNSDPTQDEDNIDLTLGLVTLDSTGTGLASVEVPKAVYERIEFDLEDGCGTGYSLYVDNSGVYQTNERMTIKFSGIFDAESAGGTLNLSIQNIISDLGSVTGGTQLKSAAEGASGTF